MGECVMRLFKPSVNKMSEENNIAGLIKALDDRDKNVRNSAREALVKIGTPALELLIAALHHQAEYVRQHAAWALGDIGEARAVEALISALEDGNWAVRNNAAYGLGQIGDARAVEVLIATLEDEDKDVRVTAREALEKIGSPAVGPLISAIKAENTNVRINAVWVLGDIKDDQAVEPLIAALQDEDNEVVRQNAAYGLGQIGHPRAVEALILALKDEYEPVRKNAAWSLGKIDDRRAVEPLIAALGDEAKGVRQNAALSLGELCDECATDALIYALGDEQDDVRKNARDALAKIGMAAVVPLVAVLKHESEPVRENAAQALGNIGDPRATEPLLNTLRDRKKSVRVAVYLALDELGWQPDESEAGVFYWVARGDWEKCREFGDLAVEPLIGALKYDDYHSRRAAVTLLSDYDYEDKRVVLALSDATWDPDRNIQSAASRALEKLRPSPPKTPTVRRKEVVFWTTQSYGEACEVRDQLRSEGKYARLEDVEDGFVFRVYTYED
jgi:HEAT repeat protein